LQDFLGVNGKKFGLPEYVDDINGQTQVGYFGNVLYPVEAFSQPSWIHGKDSITCLKHIIRNAECNGVGVIFHANNGDGCGGLKDGFNQVQHLTS